MKPFLLRWAAKQMHAPDSWLPEIEALNVSTDTRSLKPGALFFALHGEHFDGHLYVQKAFQAGAAAAVVTRNIEGAGPQIVVPDTLQAYGLLANAYRRDIAPHVAGITGSVGKTSVKEMLSTILAVSGPTLASSKNHNNEIGVPETLFRLEPQHRYAVIEMGMRGEGQIASLARIAEPQTGIITSIGYAHIELLGSREAIARTKAELLACLPASGTAVLPCDSEYFALLRSQVPDGCSIVTFSGKGSASADVALLEGGRKIRAGNQIFPLSLRAAGVHQAENAACALAAVYALSLPLEVALQALKQWPGAEGRMVLRKGKMGMTLLDDCYNAGPESMLAALQTLVNLAAPEQTVAILGDMKELGEYASALHCKVGEYVAELGIRRLCTIGELAGEAGAAAQKKRPKLELMHFASAEEAAVNAEALALAGDTVLIKGSRAMQMGCITAVLAGTEEADAH